MADLSYIGKGKIFLGPYGGGAKMRHVGNCSRLELSVDEEKKELLDYTSAGGGKANIVTRVQAVNVAMTLHDISADNLAVAAFGTTSAVAAGAVVDESHPGAYQGGLVRTTYLIDTTVAPVVKVGVTTKTVTTDYTVNENGAGIEIVVGGGIADDDTVLISYTKKAGNAVEALVQSAQEYQLAFAGLNEAQSGKPVVIDLHRVKFGPLQTFGLIGDEFAGLELAGEALSDATKGTGLSKFIRLEFAD